MHDNRFVKFEQRPMVFQKPIYVCTERGNRMRWEPYCAVVEVATYRHSCGGETYNEGDVVKEMPYQ